MIIAVVDGQGGGIGKKIVEGLKEKLKDEMNGEEEKVEILALGTNSIATSSMIKAGANYGATGENPIIYNSNKVDIIVGPIAIILANGLRGEITSKMAEAISSSQARKILIPSNKCNVEVVASNQDSLSVQVEALIDRVTEIIRA